MGQSGQGVGRACGIRHLSRACDGVRLALTASFATAADLPPLPPGLTAPAKSITLPAFNMATATGASVQSDDYKGKVIIARFWATW